MPQLSSGRHVSFSVTPLIERLRVGDDHVVWGRIAAFRLAVRSIEDLIPFVTIGYYKEGEGSLPNAPTYHSGYSIGQVLDGKAAWSAIEIEELRQFVTENARFRGWLEDQRQEIEQTIRNSPVLDPWNEGEQRQ